MISASFHVYGLDKLLNLGDKTKNMKNILTTTWHRSAKLVVHYIQQQMSATPRGADGRSFVGNFPAIQSGTLKASISYRVQGWNEFSVGSNVNYAPYLEMGTSKMGARPYLKPGLENSLDRIERLLIRDLEKIFKA